MATIIHFETTMAANGFIVLIKKFDDKTNRLVEPAGQPTLVSTHRELCALLCQAHDQPLLQARIEAINEADVAEPER